MTLSVVPSAAASPPPTDPVSLSCQRCGARSEAVQTCAPCGETLCTDCYSPWTALACGRCRTHGLPAVTR